MSWLSTAMLLMKISCKGPISASPEKTGLVVMAIKKAGEEELKLNPGSEEILREGDKMLVLGKSEQFDLLETHFL